MLSVLPCWQVGSFGGLVDEVEGLKRDKNVLMLELVRLRQQQQVRSASTPRPGELLPERAPSKL